MDADALCDLTAGELAGLVRTGEVSPVEVTRACLERIDRFDSTLHSYLAVLAEQALDSATAREREIAAGAYRGPWHGVPVAVKDLCDVRGVPTTCASPVLGDEPAERDATVVARLRDAGAVILGKLNMTEFAYAGYHPDRPAPVSPWGEARFPGHSSSGSGVATAAGLCFASLGTDTAGSIRYPAAANALVGIKPTYGRVSRDGVFPLSHTLDHVGPLARCVGDAAAMLSVIAGLDRRDPTSLAAPVPDYAAELHGGLAGLRVGVDEAYCTAGVDPEVGSAVGSVATVLAGLGASLRTLTMPPLARSIEPWLAICGVDALVAHEELVAARGDLYGPTFAEVLENAASISARDYARALVEREGLRRDIAELFGGIDVLLCPALATPPRVVDDRLSEIDHTIGSVLFTAPYNLTGNPSITFPCGFSDEGMPIAAQLVGRPLEEAALCKAAAAYEAATDWHRRRPDMAWIV